MRDRMRSVAVSKAPLTLLVIGVLYESFGRSPYDLTLGANIGVTGVSAIGLSVAIGGAGQLALGQAGFMAIGAYGTALLTIRSHLPFFLSLVIATLLAGLVGAAVGYIALRLQGSYLAMASLAVGAGLYSVVLASGTLGGSEGLVGVPPLSLFGHVFVSPRAEFNFVLVVLVTVAAVAVMLLKSRLGKELGALRDDRVAAESIGVNTLSRRVQIFALSALLGGLAGALATGLQGVVSPDSYSPEESIALFVIVALGGMGSVGGAVAGSAAVYYTTQAITGAGQYALAVTGALVIVVMAIFPDGLASIPRQLYGARRSWPSLATSVKRRAEA